MARLGLIYENLEVAHLQDIRQRRNLRRMTRYANLAFAMSDEEFRRNYRLSKELFDLLLQDLEPVMRQPTRRSDLTTKYKILVALSFYATGSYQRLVGGTQGTMMSQQSVSRALMEVTDALNSPMVVQKWLKFPETRQERDLVKRRFFENFKIPSVIGCIDGTHVAIIRPSQNEERFYNRKGYHSRNVLIIPDADLNILCVDSSFGGATHDSFVWNQHPVKENVSNLISTGERAYLLGDSGYPQRDYMMTPIMGAVPGSAEDYYSKLHCTARNTAERTIGVLKNRWRCLLGHRVLHYHPDKASKIINACCVLHNICNRALLGIDDNNVAPPADFEDRRPVVPEPNSVELRRGIEARARLVQELWSSR